MTRAELVERIRKAVDVEPLDRRAARAIAEGLEGASEELLEPLLEAAQELGVQGHGRTITVSLNVFIPLTNLCRDRCAYCGQCADCCPSQAITLGNELVSPTQERDTLTQVLVERTPGPTS